MAQDIKYTMLNGITVPELADIVKFIETQIASNEFVINVTKSGNTLTFKQTKNGVEETITYTVDLSDYYTKSQADDKFAWASTLSAYLPKSGGTMTGYLSMGYNKITSLQAPNQDYDAVHLRYANEHYLQLIGGTMSGSLVFSNDQALVKNVDNGALAIQGGSADAKGARLSLSGKDRTGGYAGMFSLRAYDGTNDKVMYGKPDGTLTWAGNDISGTPKSYTVNAGSGTNMTVYRKECYKIGRMVFVNIEGKNNTEIAEYATSTAIFTGLPAPIARQGIGVNYFDRSTNRGTRFILNTSGNIMTDTEGFEANYFTFHFSYVSAS